MDKQELGKQKEKDLDAQAIELALRPALAQT